MIGSSSTGLAFLAASWNAIDPAILNAISDESTSWYEPSYSSMRTSSIGKPARMPRVSASLMPSSIGLMNSFGIEPPVVSFSKM